MARATYAEVVKKWPGGVAPSDWTEASIGNVCTQVDAELNGMASPSTFGTGTNETEFANELVFRKCNYGRWAAGPMDTSPPPVWDDYMKNWFQSLLTDTTKAAITYIKGQDTS